MEPNPMILEVSSGKPFKLSGREGHFDSTSPHVLPSKKMYSKPLFTSALMIVVSMLSPVANAGWKKSMNLRIDRSSSNEKGLFQHTHN